MKSRPKSKAAKSVASTAKVAKPVTRCADCGANGPKMDLAKHAMFCPAKTCSECGDTLRFVIPVCNGVRLCGICLDREDPDDYEDDYDEDDWFGEDDGGL